MSKRALSYTSFCLLLSIFIKPTLAYSGEDEIFDQQKRAPLEFLEETYYETSFLALGEVGHANQRNKWHLKELLERLQKDDNLRFIVLEHSVRLAPFFEHLSRFDLKTRDFEDFHISGQLKTAVLGDYILLNEVLPLVRRINHNRDGKPPLIVVPIDSAQEGQVLGAQVPFNGSWDREERTIQNFQNLVLSRINIENGERALLFYNIEHLSLGIRATLTREALNFERGEESFYGWLSMALETNSDLRQKIKIIALDNVDHLWAPQGKYPLVERQRSRFPRQDFAIPLAPFREVIDAGLDSERFSPYNLDFPYLRSNTNLADRIFGVLWTCEDPHFEKDISMKAMRSQIDFSDQTGLTLLRDSLQKTFESTREHVSKMEKEGQTEFFGVSIEEIITDLKKVESIIATCNERLQTAIDRK